MVMEERIAPLAEVKGSGMIIRTTTLGRALRESPPRRSLLRPCAVVRGNNEWSVLGLEETQASAFFAKRTGAEQRERACVNFFFLLLAWYIACAVHANGSAGAAAAPLPSTPLDGYAAQRRWCKVQLQPQPVLSVVHWQQPRIKGWG